MTGFGALYKNSWIQGRWDVRSTLLSIDVNRTMFLTNNLPITLVWQQGTSSSKPILLLIRKLY